MQAITEANVEHVHNAQDAVIIDVREVFEFEAGHAVGAVNIPLGELGGRLDELPQNGEQFFVICQSGGRSGRAVVALRARGYDAVNVAGGTADWIDAEYEIAR